MPVRVISADDRRVAELALVENLQREDLNPIEEALGYKSLIEEYGLTQDEAAKAWVNPVRQLQMQCVFWV